MNPTDLLHCDVAADRDFAPTVYAYAGSTLVGLARIPDVPVDVQTLIGDAMLWPSEIGEIDRIWVASIESSFRRVGSTTTFPVLLVTSITATSYRAQIQPYVQSGNMIVLDDPLGGTVLRENPWPNRIAREYDELDPTIPLRTRFEHVATYLRDHAFYTTLVVDDREETR